MAPGWPYQNKPLYVFTRTPGAVRPPPREVLAGRGSNARVRAVSGDPASVLATVAGEAEGSPARTAVTRVCVYVDGGRCIRSFLDAGLVTSATITMVPVTLGDGVPLFSEEQASRLRETRSVTLANGFVQTTFEVV